MSKKGYNRRQENERESWEYTMSEKLILIDGSSVLSRNYYGSLPNSVKFAKNPEEKAKGMKDIMQTRDGLPTNGLFSMMRFLLKVIKEQQPTHLAVCWDVNRETFRKERYADYKGTRSETPSALKKQFALTKKTLEYIGIPQFELAGYEADDIIGTLAKRFQSDMPIYIITGDQDALQLVNEKTKVWFTTSKAKEWYVEEGINPNELSIPDKTYEYTVETVLKRYQLYPQQIVDLKALQGDDSDNIPGVKGVGPTAILPLLRHYGSIEKIYQAIESTPEEELKHFLKVDLGIPRSPIGALCRRSNQEIATVIKETLKKNFSKPLVKEVEKLFKECDDKHIKEQVKKLKDLQYIHYKAHAYELAETLEKLDAGLIGKEAAFVSKELATIVTNIPAYRTLPLQQLKLQLNLVNMRKIFDRLEFHSIAV